MSDEAILDLPDLPDWRVRIVPCIPEFPLKETMVGVAVWFTKLERRKKNGKWVSTVSGFHAYGSSFDAMLAAAAALQVVKDKPRHVRAGLIRPFAGT